MFRKEKQTQMCPLLVGGEERQVSSRLGVDKMTAESARCSSFQIPRNSAAMKALSLEWDMATKKFPLCLIGCQFVSE